MTSQLRKDLISGRWVIIAAERSKRPDEFRPARPDLKEPQAPAFCPFCEGNEAKTPDEIFAVRREGTAAGRPGWRVRVVPNKFPALTRGAPPRKQIHGLFEFMDGVGVHEVIIESPDHSRELDDLPVEVRTGQGSASDGRSITFAIGTPLGEIERRVIHATLGHVGGDKRLCAQLLGIATRTIYRRLEEEKEGTPAQSAEETQEGTAAENTEGRGENTEPEPT